MALGRNNLCGQFYWVFLHSAQAMVTVIARLEAAAISQSQVVELVGTLQWRSVTLVRLKRY